MNDNGVHDPDRRPALTRREPQPFVVHAAVDAAVVFLLSVVVLLILDVDIIAVVVFALVAGVVAAPVTRRAEERALAARPGATPTDGATPTEGG
jgi:hypothetical protein